MKSRFLACFTAVTVFAALAMPLRLAAQNEQEPRRELPRYIVKDLGTLGGTIGQLALDVCVTTQRCARFSRRMDARSIWVH
jgi:hypothetical protein